MLTILILFFLGTSFYAGYRRGFLLQGVYSVGYILSFMAARMYYKNLGRKLELLVPYPSPTQTTKLVLFDKSLIFDMDKAFYAGFAFVFIVFVGWALTRFIGMFCYKLTFKPIIKRGNDLIGGILNVILTLVGLTLFLTLLAMIPMDFIQKLFQKSFLARAFVSSMPVISNWLNNWWITKIIL